VRTDQHPREGRQEGETPAVAIVALVVMVAPIAVTVGSSAVISTAVVVGLQAFVLLTARPSGRARMVSPPSLPHHARTDEDDPQARGGRVAK
jgi:hypothetical protein